MQRLTRQRALDDLDRDGWNGMTESHRAMPGNEQTAQCALEDSCPLKDVLQRQLSIYANELATLYAVLRSRSGDWLAAEGRLRAAGTEAESLTQALVAAQTCTQLLLKEGLSTAQSQTLADRSFPLLNRALKVLGEYRAASGTNGRDDLGLAALLRQELRHAASEHGWEVRAETEDASPAAHIQSAAYLVVKEALAQAARNPFTRRVTLSMETVGARLIIRLTFEGREECTPGLVDDAGLVVLTQLTARLAGGACRWRTIPETGAQTGADDEVELTLPKGSLEPATQRG